MSAPRMDKAEVARMLDDDDKSKFILQVLEVDWPTALAILPGAMRAVSSEATSPEGLEVLRESLNSYKDSFGTPDRTRLNAFITPLIDGLTRLILSDPPKTQAVKEIESILAEGMGEERFSSARKIVVDYLIPPESSLGRVWASMNRG